VTFRAPMLLFLLALVPPALLFLLARERRRQTLARRFVSERLRGVSNPLRTIRPWLLALALAAGIVAVAGPRFGFTTVPIQEREANRILAIDVSNSMAAEDVGASRLDAAKAIAKRIIAAETGRTALVAFESSAEVESPLTTDDEAVASLVDSLQPGELTEPGTDLGGALLAALKLADSDPLQKADVVMISDGEDQGARLDDALRRLKSRGIIVSTVLVGTTRGSTIPGPLRDDDGRIVTTYAHPEVLQQIAHATGGHFFDNPFAEHALDTLAASVTAGAPKERNVKVPIDRYQWPLALALLLFLGGSFVNRGAE